MKKIIIVLIIFILDRVTKIYLLNLQKNGTDIDFYINSFLNFNLHMNTGIGFGLISLEASIYYHLLTFVIAIINIFLIFLLWKSKDIYSYFIAFIVGGALGNLFDRINYYAVPDFIDLHIGNYHWFLFNVADRILSEGSPQVVLTFFHLIFSKPSI